MIEIGYSLSRRHPDPPQTDYRTAGEHELRYDLFCGDVHLTDGPDELSTAWGWTPVLDFAWALCDIAERLDRDPAGSRSATLHKAELDFTETTERLRFARRFGWVEVRADWAEGALLTVRHADLRREARDFLHDLIADLTDMHEDLGDNPALWLLTARFPRV